MSITQWDGCGTSFSYMCSGVNEGEFSNDPYPFATLISTGSCY